MNTRSLLVRLSAAFTLLTVISLNGAFAQATPFNDAIGDISPAIDGGNPGAGTLDIVRMEVTDTEEDVIFTLTVNGNITAADWGNFMLGIANQKIAGSQIGNGWARPINMNAGGTNGMTHWIGSWVNGGGGSQLWEYTGSGTGGGTGSNWGNTGSVKSLVTSAGTQSTIAYTVTKASLGVVTGDTIIFDAYSSGSGNGDGAIDALSNTNVTVSTWGGTYTSQAPTISRYTLSNSALNTTQDITFSVNMSAQIAIGAFVPGVDVISADWGDGFTTFVDLADPEADGIYTGTASVSAPSGTPVPYRFTIVPADSSLPLDPETVARNFLMPTTPLELPTVFFDNAQGYRNVTFAVDMSVQETAGLFNPTTQTVEVRGSFNNFAAGSVLTAQGGGVYSATFTIGGAPDQSVEYKFFAAGPNALGYEEGANRIFTLAFNAGGAPDPALVLPTVLFSNQEVVPANRPVTFSVDVTVLEAEGGFTPGVDSIKVVGSFNNWNTGGTVYQLTDPEVDGTYSGTFSIIGAAGSSISYKFFNTKTGAPNGGYENDPNRTAVLGAADVPQVLPTVFWNNDSGQVRNIAFSVDMSVQAAKGLFNPATGTVQLRGIGSFNEGDAQPLVREGETLVYAGTFEVPGDAGSDFAYKFFSSGLTASGFEIINPDDLFINRTVTLGPADALQVLPVAYFSNELFYVTGTPLSAFATTQGTPSAAQSVTINGQGLTANIVATAPTGFEISADGITYGSTANLIPASGAVTGTNNLFVRLAASAAAGSPSGNVALTSAGSQPVNIAVTGTVTASGETFSNWSGGAALTPALQLEYAIGGATSPNATNGVPSITTVTSNTLSITAVVRTNDPTLTVTGQTLVDLAVGPWSTNDVTMTPEVTAAPEGCQVQTFSTPRGQDSKKFLRLQTTLPAEPQP